MRYLYAQILVGLVTFAGASLAPAKERVAEVTGEYVYWLPRHESRDRGEQVALERAMLSAIASEFGTLLSSSSRLDARSSEGGESADFWHTTSSLVRGEWIETLGQPEFSCRMEGDDIVISCRVRGKARETASSASDISVRVCRNDPSTEDNTFHDGDRVMLGFASAIDGYLTVFLEGEEGQVFRMLPFYTERAGSMAVEGGREYVLFSSTKGDEDQYRLTASGPVERNYIYVIFSPNEYTRPLDRRSEEDLGLRELSSADFRRWLDARRAADPRLQVAVRPITIIGESH